MHTPVHFHLQTRRTGKIKIIFIILLRFAYILMLQLVLSCLKEFFGGSLWYTKALIGRLVLECVELPEQTESNLWDRGQHPNPQLMPLPSTAYDLDWNSLVQAAQEYESKYKLIS